MCKKGKEEKPGAVLITVTTIVVLSNLLVALIVTAKIYSHDSTSMLTFSAVVIWNSLAFPILCLILSQIVKSVRNTRSRVKVLLWASCFQLLFHIVGTSNA